MSIYGVWQGNIEENVKTLGSAGVEPAEPTAAKIQKLYNIGYVFSGYECYSLCFEVFEVGHIYIYIYVHMEQNVFNMFGKHTLNLS